MNKTILATDRLNEIAQRVGARPVLMDIAMAGNDFGSARPYEVVGSTAVIDVIGPLSNSAWSWGGTTYGDIQRQMQQASSDTDVKGVLLCFNTPGGECDNAFETAAMIRDFAKPVYGVSATSCYSAGYLLASQCDELFCMPVSGGVGSIGVYSAHADLSEMYAQAGIKVTLFSAGEGKTDGNPFQPLSDTAKESFKASVDRLYSEFTLAVSAGRGMAIASVVGLGARLYEGAKAAIASGLADQSGDVTDAWRTIEGFYALGLAGRPRAQAAARSTGVAPESIGFALPWSAIHAQAEAERQNPRKASMERFRAAVEERISGKA